ncbi:hypothetical protein [Streptomyces aidingensis]|uniref:Dirigent-like protein n=1 Tax=Streptomyces aidingensis TaxID=910347 RepID=A0A1I1K5F5_9ACTN|nr:hypothetical protein [Streptomyces aidingensis]SFC53958.1 hypothetical protein SAMN05421773_10424 [Streptomyces aidingensis]
MNRVSSRPPRRPATVAAAVFALLMTGLLAPAAAAAPAPDPDREGGHHRVIEIILADTEVVHDTTEPGSGPEPGDLLLIENDAFMDGRDVGDALTRLHFFTEGEFLLDSTVQLDDRGNLVIAGGEEMENTDRGFTFAVTGGTGEFSGTGGEVHADFVEYRGEEAVRLVFHLVDHGGHDEEDAGRGGRQGGR